MCNSMFTAALIPIAKIWKQLSISGWVHKEYVVYTYTVESFSAIKKGNLAFCDNMGNKADSERQTLFDCTYYVESKKPRQTTEELRDTENWSVVIRVGEWTEGVKKVHFITIDSDQILLWLFCYMHKDQIILWYTRN